MKTKRGVGVVGLESAHELVESGSLLQYAVELEDDLLVGQRRGLLYVVAYESVRVRYL